MLLQDLLAPLRSMFLVPPYSSRDPEAQWNKLLCIQNSLIDFITIHKILLYLGRKLTTFGGTDGKLGLLQLKNLIDVLRIKANELMPALSFTAENHNLFVAFRSATEVSSVQVSKCTQLETRGSNLQTALVEIIRKSSDTTHDINENLNLEEQAVLQVRPAEPLSEIISLLHDQHSLRGKSKKVIDGRVKQFLMDLRINGLFYENFAVVIREFFELGQDELGHDCIINIREAIDLTADPGFAYYAVLLKIFVGLIRADIADADKKPLLDRYESFLVEHFLLHDEMTIRHLLKVLIGEVLQRQTLEQQNISLRALIESHLTFFEQNIGHFIDQNIAVLEIDISDSLSVSQKLTLFIDGIRVEIDKQTKFVDDLILDFSATISLSSLEYIDAQKELLKKIHTYILSVNKLKCIMLKSIELLTTLIEGYASFRKNYAAIIGENFEDDTASEFSSAIDINSITDLRETLQYLLSQSEQSMGTAHDLSARVTDAVSQSNQQVLEDIKTKIIEYKKNLVDICTFKLKCQLLFGYMQGFDIIFECAAVNYIHDLVVASDHLDERQLAKLTLILQYLNSKKQTLSTDFSDFVSAIHFGLLEGAVATSRRSVTLVTTVWGLSGLGGDFSEMCLGVEKEIAEQVTDALCSPDDLRIDGNISETTHDRRLNAPE